MREAEKKINYFFELQKIMRHYFKDFTKWLKTVTDPRHASYVKYPLEVLLLMLIMKHTTGVKTMREMTSRFNTEAGIENMRELSELETLDELPHYDTINNVLEKLETKEIEEVRYKLIRQLIRKRSFEGHRLSINGKYHWLITIDGTGLHTFKERHCEHCLKRERVNKETGDKSVIYYHHVLEAKLVLGEMVFSVCSEFIENESEEVSKQDCELKAFYRMEKKLKGAFPRLLICLTADSLYACEPVFKVCQKNNWEYIFRFKEGRLPSVAKEYGVLAQLNEDQKKSQLINHEQWNMNWVNEIAYQERELNICELEVVKEDKSTTTFVYLTSFLLDEKNIKQTVETGRSRWRIENEGFNRQKNHRGFIHHLNSYHDIAMKNHYILTQIAEIIMVLYELGLEFFHQVKKMIKEKSSDLLEAFRQRTLTAEDKKRLDKLIQVRFT